MGRASRNKPAKLAEKLFAIRENLGLSQAELIEQFSLEDIPIYKADISKYESGKREPPLLVLLRYARLGKVTMETLVDDTLELSISQ